MIQSPQSTGADAISDSVVSVSQGLRDVRMHESGAGPYNVCRHSNQRARVRGVRGGDVMYLVATPRRLPDGGRHTEGWHSDKDLAASASWRISLTTLLAYNSRANAPVNRFWCNCL